MSVIITRFLIVGPLAGDLGFVLADQASDVAGFSVSALAHPGSLVIVPILWLYGLVLAYPVGLMPAALTAFTFVKLRRSSSTQQLLLASAVGMCFAAVFSVAFFFSPSGRTILPLSWGVAGLFGGLASALTCVRVPMHPSAGKNVG